jgi:hypothetical protein
MRVLNVGKFGGDLEHGVRCGMSNFSVQTGIALRRAGAEVDNWDGDYSVIYAKIQRNEPAYLPADLSPYDVVHFVWHPITINHYTVAHWPTGPRPLCSLFLGDLPPHSGCPCLESFPFRVSALPHAILSTPSSRGLVLPYPIIDWVEDLPEPDPVFTVGYSGVRGDGRDLLQTICARHGWAFNASDPAQWLSIDDEVRRLARSTVNVCWYHEQQDIAGAPSTCLASRRPLLINRSAMLRHLFSYGDELYIGECTDADPGELGVRLLILESAWKLGVPLRRPFRVLHAHSWTTAARRLIREWESVLHHEVHHG